MDLPAIGNAILDSIVSAEPAAAALLRETHQIDVAAGARLQQADEPVASTYFLTSGVLSLYLPLEDGVEVHTAATGADGAVYACSGMNLDKAAYSVVATLPAHAICIEARRWRDFLRESAFADDLLSRYADHLLTSSQQALACLMMHDVESRLCHWLLKLHAWQQGRPIAITHRGLAQLLGVRRTTITLIAQGLQFAGIIAYTRGTIHIRDPYALQQASCECHRLGGSQNLLHASRNAERLAQRRATNEAVPLAPSVVASQR